MRPLHRTASALAGALALTVLATGVASAAWTRAGSGAGDARSTSLAAPATASASATSGTGIMISWTTAAGGPAPSGYRVERVSPAKTVCDVSAETRSCPDTGLTPSTTYQYRVVSLLSLWDSGATQASAATAAQATTLTITSPAAGATGVARNAVFRGTTSVPAGGTITVAFYLGATAGGTAYRTYTAVVNADGTWSATSDNNGNNPMSRLDANAQHTMVVSQNGATDVSRTFTTGNN